MDFDTYTDCGVLLAVDLVNHGDVHDVDALQALLQRNAVSAPGPLSPAVVDEVRALRPRLRAVFDAPDARRAAELINELLAEARALPQLTDHDGSWHLHFTPPGAPLATRLAAEAAMGLAGVLRAGDGFGRMRTCADDTCDDVFVDASRNRSRRFCNPDTCGNRAHVAAHRARRRAANVSRP